MMLQLLLQDAADQQADLKTQLKEQTEGRQQAEASLADLEQKKKQVDEVLAAEKKSRKEADNSVAEANKRLQQARQVRAKSADGAVIFAFQHQHLPLFYVCLVCLLYNCVSPNCCCILTF